MHQIIQQLNDLGCDTKSAINRLLGSEATYLTFLEKYKKTFHVAELGELLNQKQYQDAFDCVHNIKGAAGNLGLTPLYNASSTLTEKLRANDYTDLESIYQQLSDAYRDFLAAVEQPES